MRIWYGCAAAVALIMLTACGPSGPGTPAGSSPTTMSDAEVLAVGKQVAQCFRDNGIAEFPDPIVNDGQLKLPDNMQAQIESLYPQQVLDQAQQACQSLLDGLPESAIQGDSGDINNPDAPGPGDVEALRRWAECARQNGFPDWPDPKPDGSFPLTGTPIEAEGKSPRLIAVFDACNQYWSGGLTFS